MNNRDRFSEVYISNLEKAVRTHPEQYPWPVERVPQVAEKMLHAVDTRSFNKDGFAFRWTCKELGIPYTYTAINAFWQG